MALRDVFSVNLRKLGTLQKFSQDALAERADINRNYVKMNECKKNTVSVDVIEKFAIVINGRVSEFHP